MAPKMGKGGQIWLKCITVDLIMMIKYKNNIFERVKKNHADLAWNYPAIKLENIFSEDLLSAVRVCLLEQWGNKFKGNIFPENPVHQPLLGSRCG